MREYNLYWSIEDDMITMDKNKILMVDDDEAIREYLSELLAMAGYSVIASNDGIESLRIFETQPFDLVITDIMMPGIDGLGAMIKMRTIDPKIKILAISGADMKEELLHAAGFVGAMSTLQKPFSNDTLLKTITRLLG
jgi:CheY-like chemotaxis protein